MRIGETGGVRENHRHRPVTSLGSRKLRRLMRQRRSYRRPDGNPGGTHWRRRGFLRELSANTVANLLAAGVVYVVAVMAGYLHRNEHVFWGVIAGLVFLASVVARASVDLMRDRWRGGIGAAVPAVFFLLFVVLLIAFLFLVHLAVGGPMFGAR